MNKKEEEEEENNSVTSEVTIPLFTFYKSIFIILINIFIIFITFLFLLSINPSNKYATYLKEIAIMEEEGGYSCVDDSQCTTNAYCYIGKCICYDGFSGEYCNITCCEGFNGENCTVPYVETNCTIINETIIDVNCTINETIIDVNCTINEIIIDQNCTVNEIIVDQNCTVEEIMVDPNCTCVENTTCIDDSDCLYNATKQIPSGVCHYGKCDCIPGYVGDNCEYEIRDGSSCTIDFTCNAGVCVLKPPGYTSGECYCVIGTGGNYCVFPV